MVFELVDLDGGDVLGVYNERAAAIEDARTLIEQSPELADDVAVMTFDDDGRRVDDPEPIRTAVHA